jgi:lysozyme family protein
MTNISALENVNAHRWDIMHINASRLNGFHSTAVRLCDPTAKARYQGVSDRLSFISQTNKLIHPVPWWFIAIVSEREYGGPPRWDRQLGQGDPLDQKSTHEPIGMGPYLAHPSDITPGFDAWTRCCVDVLVNSAPFAAKWTSWTIGGILTLFEEYNGLGYAMRGLPSAYVWSGTDQYISGKYVADHVFDPSVVDVQDGCAPILRMMMTIDSTILEIGV